MPSEFALKDYIFTDPPAEEQALLVDEFMHFAGNDVLCPLVNSAVLQPCQTVTENVNRGTKALIGESLLPEDFCLKVTAAEPYSPGWFAQSLSGGLGALVPYTIAGKLAGGTLRGAGARFEMTGTRAALMKSEKVAFMTGAFAYDGLRPVHEGESRLGNAVSGAAAFYVFGKGNDLSKNLTGIERLSARATAGFIGGDTQITVSKIISQGQLPTTEELTQAGVGGAVMNIALPVVQEYANRKITEFQTQRKSGAPVDRYLDVKHGDAAAQSPELRALLAENEWARVRVSTHADADARSKVVDVSHVQETPGAVAKGLEHLTQARSKAHEAGFNGATAELTAGRVQDAWNQFRQVRATQELAAHQTENIVDHSLGLTDRLVPENMALELGAWPAPGGVSYEYRWRLEFQQFQDSGGKWRPGETVAATKPYDPERRSEAAPKEPLTEKERSVVELERLGTGLVTDLQKAGFLAVFAGGAVRDKVMGGTAKDFDIATRATPEQVEQLFKAKGHNVILTGKQFGVINVIVEGKQFEIASLRTDGQYTDGRRPDSVRHVNSLYEDAARRDLTINSMFQDPTTNAVYDFFGGKQDIADRRIRTVGDPHKRFSEDLLRMMRVPRFASRYEGFTVEPATAEAIARKAPEITSVSAERVRDELRGILTSRHPLTGLDFMMDSGLMKAVLPEIVELTGPKAAQDPIWHPEGKTWPHTRLVVNNLTGSRWETMLAGLLHDGGKPATQQVWPDGRISNHGHAEVGATMARDICNRFKMSNAEKDVVVTLVADHMKMHNVQEWRRSRLMDLLSSPIVEDHIALQHADAMGTGRTDGLSKSNREWLVGKQQEFASAENAAQKLGAKPIIDGRVLIGLGVKPGERLGQIKESALEAQREGAFTDIDSAKAWLAEKFPEVGKS